MQKIFILLLSLVLALTLGGFAYYEFTKQKANDEIPLAVKELWKNWRSQYHKLYYGTEENSKLQTFYQNYKKIMTHQADKSRTYDMDFNQFMDLTPEEFKSQYLLDSIPPLPENVVNLSLENVPNGVDWRQKGAVTAVKNQGQCGSCWSFSTTGAMEGRCFIDGVGLYSMSEQQLVDCTSSYGNYGCQGGYPTHSFQYLTQYCLTVEQYYPYTAQQGGCQNVQGYFRAQSYASVPQGDLNQLAAAVNQQPVSVIVDAHNWQFYSGGIFTNCGTSLDHAVLLVGYDSSSWIIKNSWGEQWGESGYIRLGGGNTCGIASGASYPTGCVRC
jgi:C1A family cysteine protease